MWLDQDGKENLGKTWPPRGKENIATLKIGHKYVENTQKISALFFFWSFFSYFALEGIFLLCRGPSFSQIKSLKIIFLAGYPWNTGMVPDINFMEGAFLCRFRQKKSGCPAIWVGTSRDQKNYVQGTLGFSVPYLKHRAQ